MDSLEINVNKNGEKKERKMILEMLLPLYNQNIGMMMDGDELSKNLEMSDKNYLAGTVVYLQKKGLVELDMYNGGFFRIRLTAYGFESMKDHLSDSSQIMTNAYRILFVLENSLRKFIEAKMRSKFGSNWWESGINSGIKKKATQKRDEESAFGWTISTTESELEYLMFKDLEGIITKNWKDVFETIFRDQKKITLRLNELEAIRNSIAHTRTLSLDALTRLGQYSQDLFNLTRNK